MSPAHEIGRAAWRYFRHPGTDRATLTATDHGYRLAGSARLRFPEGPTAFRYVIECDGTWQPHRARVDLRLGRQRRSLQIEIDEKGEWAIGGLRRREMRGFTDVDLSTSPSTNTLALRRLDLLVGGSAEIEVGWVVFPDLEVRAVRQRYSRLSERRYRYEGLHNGFVADFEVDHLGFVTEYPEFWERLPAPAKRASREARRRPPKR